MSESDISITSEGIKVHATEKVSTGEYESADVSASLEASVEGADLSNGIPNEVKNRIYALERTMQGVVQAAAEERKKKSQ